jgi:flagellar M-ring protein FliF
MEQAMQPWWNALAPRARRALLAAVAGVLLALAAAAAWLLRSDPAVLFSELRPQDAAAMTAELERLKVPYSVADNGATLLVERSQVHALRLKLMGKELPLHGTVGLELFNTTDFGMTEFAQKINFQRALQGELTRTILSFPEVRDARVHLVLPEQGLFRQNAARAKAAVTLGLRPGQALRPEQVAGIQRLVAASVPGLAPQEVTLVDQRGIALSRPPEDAEAPAAGARLELKRETEKDLTRKAAAVLDQAFGPGQALASVDVVLNMDQVRVTTEDVLTAPDGKSGVLVRERESARDSAAPDERAADGRTARGSSMQRDAEYQAGRRVEQVVSQPGAIRRIQVVAVVRQPLQPPQEQQLQRLLAAAVGASTERGDTVVVQALQPAAPPETAAAPAAAALPAAAPPKTDTLTAWVAGAAVLLLLGLLFARRARRPRLQPARMLTEAERRAALQRVQGWLLQSANAAPARSERGMGERQ